MSLPKDKKMHAAGGLAIWLVALLLGAPLLLASGLACAAGLLKELYDSRHPDRHTVDPLDWFWTGWLAAIGSVLVAMFKGPIP